MRRLVTSAVLVLGTALLVSSAFAQSTQTQGTEGAIDKNRQVVKIGTVYVDGSGDTIVVRVRSDDDGTVHTSEQSKDRDYGDLKGTGISAATIASGATYFSTLVDLSTYRFATLLLTWGTAVAADSDSVNIALRVYNKSTDSWGTDDTPVSLMERRPTMADTSVVAATWLPLLAQNTSTGTRVPPPTLYLYRNTGTMLNATGTVVPLYGLGKVPRMWVPNGGVAIDLTTLCGQMQFSYLGFTLSNWGRGTSLTNVKAQLWVSR